MQRLLRACAAHQSERPSCSMRQLRSGSPAPGGSTLITSAPNSARMRAATGAAINVPSSTTRTPCSACCAMAGEAPKGPPKYHVCGRGGNAAASIGPGGAMATTTKPYDKALPFTRINSPSEDLVPTRLSGDGHTRGTRREGDFLEQALIDKILRKLILLTPSWTTTRGTTERDVEQESQGK